MLKYLSSFKIFLLLVILTAATGIFPVRTFAQFGQNKVQYKVFDWSFIQSKHFDIYFSQGGEEIAQFTAIAAESSLVSLRNNIGYDIKNRIPILVFNSHNDFQQNNAVDEYLPEGVGGVTELFKNRVLVPFEGDYAQFRHVIHHELLHAYMNDLYYGGSIQNIITQNIRLQFPTWFSEGQAEYQSLNGMDKANDMFMRDAVVYDYMPPVEYIDGYLSYRGGQAFFSWLADEFGKDKVGDLFLQIKAIGDVDEGFKDIYKLTLEELSEKWHKHLKQTYWPDINARQELKDFAIEITKSRKGDGYYNTAPSISPKGDMIAYISNKDDYFDVYIADIKTGKIIKKLIEGNRTANFEELHLLTPGLCWSPDGKRIAIAVKSGSQDAMYIFDVEDEDYYELPLKFDGIFSANWNPKNNSIVFVGNNSKQSDIYVYNITTKKLIPITNDLFSDSYPNWSSDGTKIYFTSDRSDYTIHNNIPSDLKMQDYEYGSKDIYVYDLSGGTISMFINDNSATESDVVSSPDGKKILYISDKSGIGNIYMRNLETNEDKPITNSISGIEQLSISEDGKRLSFRALHKGGYDIFYIDNPFDVDIKLNEIPLTSFQDKIFKNLAYEDSVKRAQEDLEKLVRQTDSTVITNINTSDSSLISKDSTGIYGNEIALNLNDVGDTNTGTAKLKLKERSKFRIVGNTNQDGSFKVNKYKIKFSPDIIYSNVSYSSFYGVQGIAQMAFSDVTGNHRIYVATSLVLDLKNSDYAFAYYYLPKRIDYGLEAFHSARFLLIEKPLDSLLYLHRYRTYGVNLNASYPISKFNRLDGGLSFAILSKENLDDPTEPTERLYTVLPTLSFVHDNTLFGYTAPIRGKRFNLTMYGTPKLGSNGAQFFSAIMDYRKYFYLFNDFNFVWRLNAGFSVGKTPQKFYLGGTPSWINYEVEGNTFPIEDLKDFAFSMPVYPLRGYNYDFASGSKFALMNAELRFPLFRYLVLGPLPLAFQNIQGVMFLDAATVWTNNKTLQLFQKDANGDLRTKDLLLGMGVGARIFLLYFPFKFDVAWTYDMKKFSKPKYYISLGADF